MAYQKVFKRHELKFIVTKAQKAVILQEIKRYMIPDRFGRSTIRNIYFDTDDYILARHSIVKPDFKEKLRIRSYDRADRESTVFVELKRKFDHVVYKRRVAMPEAEAMKWMQGANAGTPGAARGSDQGTCTQMQREIEYFLSYYSDLRPMVFLSYNREAYRMKDTAECSASDSDFRVTFDENILCRDYDISLASEIYGDMVLDEYKVLMELKCSGGIPRWMTKVLSEERIYKTAFSKYGTAYKQYILPEQAKELSAAGARMAAGSQAAAVTKQRSSAVRGFAATYAG